MKYVFLFLLLTGCASETIQKKCADLHTIAIKDSKGEDACWTGQEVIYPATTDDKAPRETRR